MSGVLHKKVTLYSLNLSEAADRSIFRVDWEHKDTLSCSAHSKEIVVWPPRLAGYGFASMQQEQKILEMTANDD